MKNCSYMLINSMLLMAVVPVMIACVVLLVVLCSDCVCVALEFYVFCFIVHYLPFEGWRHCVKLNGLRETSRTYDNRLVATLLTSYNYMLFIGALKLPFTKCWGAQLLYLTQACTDEYCSCMCVWVHMRCCCSSVSDVMVALAELCLHL